MMYIKIAIYRQASMNIRIDVGQQQNWWWWWWWGGVHKAKKILLHFSLNHGILSRMALFLEKLEFFFYFRTPSPSSMEFSIIFFFFLNPSLNKKIQPLLAILKLQNDRGLLQWIQYQLDNISDKRYSPVWLGTNKIFTVSDAFIIEWMNMYCVMMHSGHYFYYF